MDRFFVIMSLFFSIPTLCLGQTMTIENIGGNSQTYNLTDIRSIKFNATDMLVISNSGSTDNYPIQDIDLYRIDLDDDSSTSIDELNKDMALVLYPNPASGVLNISLAVFEEGTIDIVITDLSGRLIDNVFSGPSNENMKISWEYHDKNIPAGTYFCIIKTTTGMVSKPITLK